MCQRVRKTGDELFLVGESYWIGTWLENIGRPQGKGTWQGQQGGLVSQKGAQVLTSTKVLTDMAADPSSEASGNGSLGHWPRGLGEASVQG